MRIAILQRHEPLANGSGIEMLDLALALANLEQEVGLFFVDAGVLQLWAGQTPAACARKDHIKTYGALAFYDLEQVFVCAASLAKYGLAAADLVIPVTALDSSGLPQALGRYQQVINT